MRRHATTLPPHWPGNSRRRRRALIGLTPLIDVVFILLVFFMLASSFLDWRAIDLQVPGSDLAGASMEGALLVQIRPGGLRLSGEEVSLEALGARIERHLDLRPDRRVLIQPAPGVVLQETVRVLDRLAVAGATRMSLTSPEASRP